LVKLLLGMDYLPVEFIKGIFGLGERQASFLLLPPLLPFQTLGL
jgi:hypothetical protein